MPTYANTMVACASCGAEAPRPTSARLRPAGAACGSKVCPQCRREDDGQAAGLGEKLADLELPGDEDED